MATTKKQSMEAIDDKCEYTFFISLNANSPIQISPFTIHCQKNWELKN